MAIEAFAVAGASLATIIIAKIKFYVKKTVYGLVGAVSWIKISSIMMSWKLKNFN